MGEFNFYTDKGKKYLASCFLQIVYYGLPSAGKRTSLTYIHSKSANNFRSEIVYSKIPSLLSFDIQPLTLGRPTIVIHLAGVSAQKDNNVCENVLANADGIVFVIDSQENQKNVELIKNIPENIPIVIQWNKRDAKDALSIATLETTINYRHFPAYPTIATSGKGVFPALKRCACQIQEIVTTNSREIWSTPQRFFCTYHMHRQDVTFENFKNHHLKDRYFRC